MNGEKRFRELTIDKRAIDEESRTVELAFSSETPYERKPPPLRLLANVTVPETHSA